MSSLLQQWGITHFASIKIIFSSKYDDHYYIDISENKLMVLPVSVGCIFLFLIVGYIIMPCHVTLLNNGTHDTTQQASYFPDIGVQ